MAEMSAELHNLLRNEAHLKGLPVLVLANKQDAPVSFSPVRLYIGFYEVLKAICTDGTGL